MYRRIEVMNEQGPDTTFDLDPETRYHLRGIGGIWRNTPPGLEGEIVEAFSLVALKAPNLRRPYKSYFTQDGWNKIGRRIIAALQQYDVYYRVLAVKEKSVDVLYKDKWQVAVRPRKKRNSSRVQESGMVMNTKPIIDKLSAELQRVAFERLGMSVERYFILRDKGKSGAIVESSWRAWVEEPVRLNALNQFAGSFMGIIGRDKKVFSQLGTVLDNDTEPKINSGAIENSMIVRFDWSFSEVKRLMKRLGFK